MQQIVQRIAVLASHEGTTLQTVMDACANGVLNAEVVLVISNNSGSGALRRAKDANIKALHISGKTHPEGEGEAILTALTNAATDWVLTLGYMKKVAPSIVDAFANKIINTHPSLLPRFGGHGLFGDKVFEAILASDDTESGVSIHLVDNIYDNGAVIAQASFAIQDLKTVHALKEKAKSAEKELLISTLNGLFETH